MTKQELGNQHGYQCPQCVTGDELSISATMNVQARLSPDGCDDDGGDIVWDETSLAFCGCGWEGTVNDLKTIEVED